MSIERNYPVDIWDADLVPRYYDKKTLVFLITDIDNLLTKLSKECKSWQESDGKIWWDSPESWLRKQLNLLKEETK